MYSQTKIYELALGALKLSRTVTSTTDRTKEVAVMNRFFEVARTLTLTKMDLDSTLNAEHLELLLIEDRLYEFAYKYPTHSLYFRRVVPDMAQIDTRDSQVRSYVARRGGQKVVLTNQSEAIGEYIDSRVLLEELSAPAGLAIAYNLAMMSANFIVGKGSKGLMGELESTFKGYVDLAKAVDASENQNFNTYAEESEFIRRRTSGP